MLNPINVKETIGDGWTQVSIGIKGRQAQAPMDVKQGAEYLHAASIPMCKLIKKELLNLLETVTSDQLEVSVVSFMEACELNFPKQFSKEVLK